MSFASHMITFLLCIARSSTQPRPNSRAATSQACGKSCEISSVITESLNEEAPPVRQVNGSAAMPTPRRKSRRVGIGRLYLRLLCQRERKDGVPGDDRDLLPAVGGVADRGRVNRRAELHVPEVLARVGVECDQVALAVSGEHEAAGRRRDAGPRVGMLAELPADVPGLRIDRANSAFL